MKGSGLYDVDDSIPPRLGEDCLVACVSEAERIADEARRRGCNQTNYVLRSPVAPLEAAILPNKGLPNLHSAVLSFSARLLTYVNDKCAGIAPTAYKRAGVSRQVYSRIISSNDSTVDKRTVMLFCIGLQLSLDEAQLLMKSAGYAFSDTIPEDMIFSYCIENQIWNLYDINEIFKRCGLGVLIHTKDLYR